MRYRIIVQEREGSDKHIHNITFESDDIDAVITKIRNAVEPEIIDLFNQKSIPCSTAQTIINETDDDLIDWAVKGNDISKEEFIENEIFFDVM